MIYNSSLYILVNCIFCCQKAKWRQLLQDSAGSAEFVCDLPMACERDRHKVNILTYRFVLEDWKCLYKALAESKENYESVNSVC